MTVSKRQCEPHVCFWFRREEEQNTYQHQIVDATMMAWRFSQCSGNADLKNDAEPMISVLTLRRSGGSVLDSCAHERDQNASDARCNQSTRWGIVAVVEGELCLRFLPNTNLILRGAPESRNQMIASPAPVGIAGISSIPSCDNPGS
jgi:hypothetical protein